MYSLTEQGIMRITGNKDIGNVCSTFAQAAESKDKIRIAVIQGSARHQESCPDQWGKTRGVIEYALKGLPGNVEVDFIDLAVRGDGNIIQPCKACISTSGGFHCHFPCSCYTKGDQDLPDFMHNEDIYARLEKVNGFAVFTPINWYAPSSVVKSFFDRLVCVNLTIPVEVAKKLTGDDIKNKDKTRALEKSGKHHSLLKNHLEGRVAAFFVHGDNGGADYKDFGGPEAKMSPSIPEAYRDNLETKADGQLTEGIINNPVHAVLPLVWQCRYSGIYVPDNLVVGIHVNSGYSYATSNDRIQKNKAFYERGRKLLQDLVGTISSKKSPKGPLST